MTNLQKNLTAILTVLLGISLFGNVFLFMGQTAQSQRLQRLEQQAGISAEEIPATFVEESAIITTVENVRPSVVSIIQTQNLPVARSNQNPFFSDPFFREFFPELPVPEESENEEGVRERVQTGAGSGFVYAENGLIMTNRHVVADENAEYTVVLYDGTELEAEVLARDSFNDIAVIRITDPEMPDLQPLRFGNSDDLQIGQRVVAIGNALAEFQNTVTSGIISGISRDIVASGRRGSEQIHGLLQTDAAINPGNSGGPLVNLAGEVVGMNTAIASGAEGIGFAIPANDLKTIADSVAEHGRIVRPFLGVQYMMLTEVNAGQFGVEITAGALLIGNSSGDTPSFAVVRGSPAAAAGLQEGDVITAIGGAKVTLEDDLRELISRHEVGETVVLEVWRDGETREVEVTLEELE